MISSGIEPATFRTVAQNLNHCATAVPPLHPLLPHRTFKPVKNTREHTRMTVLSFETPMIHGTEYMAHARGEIDVTNAEVCFLFSYWKRIRWQVNLPTHDANTKHTHTHKKPRPEEDIHRRDTNI